MASGVRDPSEIPGWDDEVDVLVVGLGAAGAAVVVAARTSDDGQSRIPGTLAHTANLVEEAGEAVGQALTDSGVGNSVDRCLYRVADAVREALARRERSAESEPAKLVTVNGTLLPGINYDSFAELNDRAEGLTG